MRKLVIVTMVSLDGVMQAPGGKEEDASSGFKFGGWVAPLFDEKFTEVMAKEMAEPYDLLLGRKTYDIFAGYWPEHTDNPIGRAFASATKYVVSNKTVDTSWKETVQIKGDVPAELGKLKESDGPTLQVHGSGNLIQTLLQHDLADELWLRICPITLGPGKRLWGEGVRPAAWKLLDSTTSTTGVIYASYARDGDVKTGAFD